MLVSQQVGFIVLNCLVSKLEFEQIDNVLAYFSLITVDLFGHIVVIDLQVLLWVVFELVVLIVLIEEQMD